MDCLLLGIYAPYDPEVDLYIYSKTNLALGTAVPHEYSGWREEVMSWKETCYLHVGLNPPSLYRVKGPGAERLLSDICVNSFASFPVGTLKHGIMCDDDGLILVHGVLLRVGDDEFLGYYRAPYIPYRLAAGRYHAECERVVDGFIFQLGGPRSLEILESATGECLHDIKFGHHRPSSIEGMEVRIVRMGMAGTLAYEVHGLVDEAVAIYDAIMRPAVTLASPSSAASPTP